MQLVETTTLAGGLTFGEGPRWHDGRLWLSDIPGNRVLTMDEDGGVEVAVETESPSGLGWLPDGRLVISCLGVPQLRCVDEGVVSVLHDLSELGRSLNDMVVAPDGRIYVDLYRRGERGALPPGDILLVTDEGVRIVAPDLECPNGLALTPDGTTLLASETGRERVLAFTVDRDGGLRDQRVFAELGAGRCPDGLCLDAEGAVWVASYTSGEVLRVLEGGEITHRVETPGRSPVATALGGDDRRTLFVVVNDTVENVKSGASIDGSVEQARVDVPGVDSP
jgi:sugar lactone lactonase YvrE